MLFPFILPSFSYQPNSFQDMLERVKASTSRLTSATRSPCFQRWSPILLILLTTVFILFGATCFYLFERDPQEMTVRKWYMNLAVERFVLRKSLTFLAFFSTYFSLFSSKYSLFSLPFFVHSARFDRRLPGGNPIRFAPTHIVASTRF